MAEPARNDSDGTLKTGDAVTYLVGNAVSGAIVAASVACPLFGVAVAVGIAAMVVCNIDDKADGASSNKK